MEEAVETYDNIGEIDTSPDSSRHPSRASSSSRSMTPSPMDETAIDQEAEWNKLIKPCYVKLMRRSDVKSLEAKSKLTISMYFSNLFLQVSKSQLFVPPISILTLAMY